ncbi:MAG: YggT family protein [Gemmatimonadaceae bacterium]
MNVSTVLGVFNATYSILRIAFLVLAIVFGVLCIVDWLVRTRRINPMGRVGRFARRSIEPLLAPIEKRVVRAGALPTNAPLYALVAIVLAGIVVLSLLDFIRAQLFAVSVSANAGPRGLVLLLVRWSIGLLQIALIVRVISSWVRISPYSGWVRWSFVLTEWLLAPLRRVIPPLGMIDITPIVAFFVIQLLGGALMRII